MFQCVHFRLEIVYASMSQCTHSPLGFLGMWGLRSLSFSTSFSNVINRLQLTEKCNLHYKPFGPDLAPVFLLCN